MANRVVLGDLGGTMGLRVSRPRFDVLTQPFGAAGIAFDSRMDDVGTVWMTGTCGSGQVVPFPETPAYTPLLRYYELSGSTLYEGDLYTAQNAGGAVTNVTWPWVGIVYPSYFMIQQQVNPFYGFTPSGGIFAYVLFRGRV